MEEEGLPPEQSGTAGAATAASSAFTIETPMHVGAGFVARFLA